MRRLAVLALVLASSPAGAEPFDRIAEGAPIYAAVRPIALSSALKRAGLDQLAEIQALKRNMGVDPFDTQLLAPTGLDVAATIGAGLFETLPQGRYHHRIVATLKDQPMFVTFLSAIAASGQAPVTMIDPASPAGKLGVRASGTLPDGTMVIARVDGDTLILDAVGVFSSKKKPPAAIDVARQFPLAVKSPFTTGQGARRLFAPEAAVVIYADGRKLPAFLETADHADDAPRKKGEPDKVAACHKAWAAATSTFDDAGFSLSVDPAGLEVALAWGTLSGTPLGGLRFHPVDDGALDVDALAPSAPITAALYAANLAAYSGLKRSGPQASFDELSRSVDRCGALAWGHVVVRSWPQGLGALAGEAATKGKAQGDPMAGVAVNAIGQLRNVAFALRRGDEKNPRGALTATFDPAARSMFELFFASAPGGGKTLPLGKRSPTVYHLGADMGSVVAAMETLASGPAALTISDSDESLGWALKTAPSVKARVLPLFTAHVDGEALAKMPMIKNAFNDEDSRRFLEILVRLRRLDGKVVAEGDLLRVSLRAAVK